MILVFSALVVVPGYLLVRLLAPSRDLPSIYPGVVRGRSGDYSRRRIGFLYFRAPIDILPFAIIPATNIVICNEYDTKDAAYIHFFPRFRPSFVVDMRAAFVNRRGGGRLLQRMGRGLGLFTLTSRWFDDLPRGESPTIIHCRIRMRTSIRFTATTHGADVGPT